MILDNTLQNRTCIQIKCGVCGISVTRRYRAYKESVEKYGQYKCHKCVRNSPETKLKSKITKSTKEYKKKQSDATKKSWADPEIRKRIIESLRSEDNVRNLRENSVNRWKSDEYRNKQKQTRSTDEYKEKWAEICNSAEYKEKWAEIRSSDKYINRWAEIRASDEFKNKMAVAQANQPKISSLQTILYSILDDLGIKYYREWGDKPHDSECIIGPYNFDCVIPRENRPALLIECQGEYWHNRPEAIKRDKAKASYILNNLSDKYEIKCLWEHEFKCKSKISETIKYWMGITQPNFMNFNFNDVVIKKCPAKDYKLLLSKYHYLSSAGRGGIAYGAYLGEELIGVCIFSPLARQNIRTNGCGINTSRELSRLCIHPNYQKKNLASWFVSRCLKMLDPKYKLIISYCDTTFNHDGAVYKACNFQEDGKTIPDYWYVDKAGWVMHKKTLYNHAVNMGMKESEYVKKYKYSKVFGKYKLRFVYKR